MPENLESSLDALSTPVVGVGASAGGLEAFTQLLTGLPVDTGMAYLLVQHLDPTHESALVELLGRSSTVPVQQATNGMRVDPNQAYVIPPNAAMTLIDGHVKLEPRNQISQPPMVIDEFFRSVADVRGNRAVGIVLSGSGTDGALGIEAIRDAGGVVLVQEPTTAAYNGMPLAAIATGCADFILPPKEIAALMSRVGQQVDLYPHEIDESTQKPDTAPAEQTTNDIPHILQMLWKRTGVDFAQYKIGTVQRRLLRRMLLRQTNTPLEYLSLIRSDPAEIDTLYDDLLIGVTSFFRDPDVFKFLRKEVIPAIMARRMHDTPFRAWVPGCSTGEEVYSIAICLLEALGENAEKIKVDIFATDINDTAVLKARIGSYSAESVENSVSPERIRRFFVKDNDGYHVSHELRDMCVFARQNVTSDPPFSQIDLISCRNLLIYLQPVLQKKLFETFHFALNQTGVLMLGNSETTGAAPQLFAPIDKAQSIYTRCSVPTAPLQFGAVTSPEPRRHPDQPAAVVAPKPEIAPRLLEVQRAADQLIVARYTPAAVVINDNHQILQFRGKTTSYMDPAPGSSVTLDVLKLVRRELVPDLRKAITATRHTMTSSHITSIPMQRDGESQLVDVEVIPFKLIHPNVQFFLITFAESAEDDIASTAPLEDRPRATPDKSDARLVGNLRQEIEALERHLQAVINDHEATIEALHTASIESQLRNEKLQTTAEEFATTKEELQSTNEELTTVNDEVRARNIQLGVLNDTQKRQTQEVEEARQYAAAIVETVLDPLLVLDELFRVHTANQAFYNTFRISPADTVSRLLFELGNGQWNIPRLRVLLDSVLKHKTSFDQFEVIHTFPVIDKKTMLLNARRLTVGGDRTSYILLGIEDISARRSFETRSQFLEAASVAVRASLDYDTTLRVLANMSVPAFADWCMIDLQGSDGTWRRAKVVYHDPKKADQAERISADAFAVPGNPVFPVLQTSTSFLAEEVSPALLETLSPNESDLERVRTLNPESIIVVPLSVSGQTLGAITFISTDSGRHYTRADLELAQELGRRAAMALEHITLFEETAKARDAAETANRVKSEFLATMSHELRTPLNAILGYAQLLQMELSGPITPEQRRDLQRIEYSQRHLSHLINGILDFAKIGTGHMVFTIVDVSLDQILSDTDALIRAQIIRKGLHYEYRPCGEECVVLADVSKLQQIVVNLLSNAIKFTAADGNITLTYKTDESHVLISVIDDGIGIAPDKLEIIFDPFMQIDNALTRTASGTGLGLSISRELARGMGGDIEAASVVGEGSTFTLTLLKSGVAQNAS